MAHSSRTSLGLVSRLEFIAAFSGWARSGLCLFIRPARGEFILGKPKSLVIKAPR